MTEKISGGAFKQMVAFGAACITAQKQSINDLNVFPVPDGDTGTNMSLTIQTAVTELRRVEPSTLEEAAKITASGLLRGARGNSGVILSLLFRGMSKVFKGLAEADGAQLAAAMQEGVTTAYGAVMKPAEGTVLTVSRLAAQRALEAAGEQNSAEYVLDEAIKTGYSTLAETIEMNPVLKKAGVVDAGGKGYLIILEGMLRSLRGEPVPEVEDTAEDKADFAAIGDEDITFAFDTVFIVRKNDPNVDLAPFRAYLDSIGDSLVIGEDDESFKVHVHTDTPGEALTAAQRYGTLELAKIENMRTQAADLAAGRKAQSTDDLDAIEAELEQLGRRIADAEEANAAVELASEALRRADETLRARFSPQITAEAGHILAELTENKYPRVLLEPDMHLSVREADGQVMRPAAAMSCGTADQMYLALRLAMCRRLLPPDAPMVLDDALVNFDPARTRAALRVLREEPRQILLFTCRPLTQEEE